MSCCNPTLHLQKFLAISPSLCVYSTSCSSASPSVLCSWDVERGVSPPSQRKTKFAGKGGGCGPRFCTFLTVRKLSDLLRFHFLLCEVRVSVVILAFRVVNSRIWERVFENVFYELLRIWHVVDFTFFVKTWLLSLWPDGFPRTACCFSGLHPYITPCHHHELEPCQGRPVQERPVPATVPTGTGLWLRQGLRKAAQSWTWSWYPSPAAYGWDINLNKMF